MLGLWSGCAWDTDGNEDVCGEKDMDKKNCSRSVKIGRVVHKTPSSAKILVRLEYLVLEDQTQMCQHHDHIT